jgi:putative transcriptional regulator
MTVNNRFGVLLAEKCIKERRRIALSEVAENTGITWKTLQQWSNNTVTRYDAPVIEALCNYFGCTVGELIVHEN